jgi:hypothetical protein
MWVVTREINEYDQDGAYFVAVYTDMPDFTQLKALLPQETDTTIGKLTRGGGREKDEQEWFYLEEVECRSKAHT